MGGYDSPCSNGWRRLVRSEISMLFWITDPGSWPLTTRKETDAMNAVPKPCLKDKPLSDKAADSYTMPARLYTDPHVFEQEKEAIFAKSWHYIGHQSHVAKIGDYLTLDIADESVFCHPL